jgi:hypothetical protein
MCVVPAPFGFSGFVPYPRLTFTPLKWRLNWLPLPCDRRYRLLSGSLLPRLLRSLCPALLDHLKRGQPSVFTERQSQRSSHVLEPNLKQLRGRLTSSPFGAAAPSDSVFAPVVVGIEHRRFPSFHWATGCPVTES